MKQKIIKILDDNLDFEFVRGGGTKQFINIKDFEKIADEIMKLYDLPSDKDMKEAAKKNSRFGNPLQFRYEVMGAVFFMEGAKWLRDLILNKQ